MKVFISADMEGATGVVHRDQLMPEGKTWDRACRLLTGDINALVEGVLAEAPEAEFVVADGHGVMRNVRLEDLHEAAALVTGPATAENRPLCQVQGVDRSFDLALFVGYHSRAGTPNGLLSHTWVGSTIANLRLEGRIVGESALNAAIVGSFGVPLGLVAGASDLVAEARETLPEGPVLVQTKQTLGPTSAICLPPARTARLLREGASEAVRRLRAGDLPTLRSERSVTIAVETYRREQTSRALGAQGVQRVSERTFRVTGEDAAEAASLAWRAIVRAQELAPGWLA